QGVAAGGGLSRVARSLDGGPQDRADRAAAAGRTAHQQGHGRGVRHRGGNDADRGPSPGAAPARALPTGAAAAAATSTRALATSGASAAADSARAAGAPEAEAAGDAANAGEARAARFRRSREALDG